jgi:hypothetical protein
VKGRWVTKPQTDSDFKKFKDQVPKADWAHLDRRAVYAFVWEVLGSLPNRSAGAWEWHRALTKWAGPVSYQGDHLTLQGVQSQINHDWPVLAEQEGVGGETRWDVVCGYEDSNIAVMRPGIGGPFKWMPFFEYNNEHDGYYHWIQTFFNIGK